MEIGQHPIVGFNGAESLAVPRTTRAARYRGGADPCTSAISSAPWSIQDRS